MNLVAGDLFKQVLEASALLHEVIRICTWFRDRSQPAAHLHAECVRSRAFATKSVLPVKTRWGSTADCLCRVIQPTPAMHAVFGARAHDIRTSHPVDRGEIQRVELRLSDDAFLLKAKALATLLSLIRHANLILESDHVRLDSVGGLRTDPW